MFMDTSDVIKTLAFFLILFGIVFGSLYIYISSHDKAYAKKCTAVGGMVLEGKVKYCVDPRVFRLKP